MFQNFQIQKGEFLMLKEIQKSNQGSYSCIAKNVHGKDDIVYNVTVESK